MDKFQRHEEVIESSRGLSVRRRKVDLLDVVRDVGLSDGSFPRMFDRSSQEMLGGGRTAGVAAVTGHAA